MKIQRCLELLTAALPCTDCESFRSPVSAEQFVDASLRQSVSRLRLHGSTPPGSQPLPKRRRLSTEPMMLRSVIARLCKLFKADVLEDYERLETLVVYVHCGQVAFPVCLRH